MRRMNYGDLPSKEAFYEAFEQECGEGETFAITHGSASKPMDPRPPAGDYSASDLYHWCDGAIRANREGGLEWVSSILGRLGFEWV